MSPTTVTGVTGDPDLDAAADAVLAASRALVAVSARSIARVPGVTFPQFRMLVVLADGTLNLSELAEHLDVAPSTAMRMVDRLIGAGLVERSVRPENRRQTLLSLTPAGRRTVKTVTARRRRDLRAVLERMAPARRAEVARSLAAFSAAADDLWGAGRVPGAGG